MAFPGWSYDGAPADGVLRALVLSGDPRQLPGAKPSTSSRLYACLCRAAATSGHQRCQGEWTDDFDGGLPWTCGGHPVPTAVDIVHGLDVSGPAARAVDDAIAAPPLTGVPPRRQNVLAHLVAVYGPGPVATGLCLEVAKRLERDDPKQVRFAWGFFWCHPTAPGADRCGPALHRRVAWLARTPDPVDARQSLLVEAVDAVKGRLSLRDAAGLPSDRDAVSALWEAAISGDDPSPVRVLGMVDPAWVVGQAGAFLARWPDGVRSLLQAVGAREDLGPALSAWVAAQPARRDAIRPHAALLAPGVRAALAL